MIFFTNDYLKIMKQGMIFFTNDIKTWNNLSMLKRKEKTTTITTIKDYLGLINVTRS